MKTQSRRTRSLEKSACYAWGKTKECALPCLAWRPTWPDEWGTGFEIITAKGQATVVSTEDGSIGAFRQDPSTAFSTKNVFEPRSSRAFTRLGLAAVREGAADRVRACCYEEAVQQS